MSETCLKCGATNPDGRSTCVRCGAELETAMYAEMFGPPPVLKGRYATQRVLQRGSSVSLYRAVDRQAGNQPCLIHQVTLTSLETSQREPFGQFVKRDGYVDILFQPANWYSHDSNLAYPNCSRNRRSFPQK